MNTENLQKELLSLIEHKARLDPLEPDYLIQMENLSKTQQEYEGIINQLNEFNALSQKFDITAKRVEASLAEIDKQIPTMSREELLKVLERKQNFENKKV